MFFLLGGECGKRLVAQAKGGGMVVCFAFALPSGKKVPKARLVVVENLQDLCGVHIKPL